MAAAVVAAAIRFSSGSALVSFGPEAHVVRPSVSVVVAETASVVAAAVTASVVRSGVVAGGVCRHSVVHVVSYILF